MSDDLKDFYGCTRREAIRWQRVYATVRAQHAAEHSTWFERNRFWLLPILLAFTLGALTLATGCSNRQTIWHGKVVELKHEDGYMSKNPDIVTMVHTGNSMTPIIIPGGMVYHAARDYIVVEAMGPAGKMIRNEIKTGPDFDGFKVGDVWDRAKATKTN